MPTFRGGMYWTAALSDDGDWIATGTTKLSQVWDVQTADEKTRFEQPDAEIMAVIFNADATRVLSGGGKDEGTEQPEDNSIRLWNRATGNEIRRFDGHTGQVRLLQFSPDGTRITSGAFDSTSPCAAKLWNTNTGALLHTFPQYVVASLTRTPTFRADGNAILLQTQLGAQVVDAATGAVICSIAVPGSDDGFNTVEFSPDGSQVVSAAGDETARIWNATTGVQIRVLTGHRRPVRHASYNESGNRIVTGSEDRTVRIWRVNDGEQLHEFRNRGDVEQAYFVGGNRRILSQWRTDGDDPIIEGVSMWDIDTGTEDFRISGGRILAIRKDGKRILVTDYHHGGQLWNTVTGELVREYPRNP